MATLKRFFKNITPLFILTIFGILICLVEIVILLFSKDKGELATGVLAIWALGAVIIFLVDRYLIERLAYKKVFIIEIVFILLLPFLYLYSSKSTRIYVDTGKSYFLLVYTSKGLTKKEIPGDGLFDHSIIFKDDRIIYLDYSLLSDNTVDIVEPRSWYGYKVKYLDTVISSNKIEIQMRSNDLPNEQRDSIFKKLLHMVDFRDTTPHPY